MGKSLLRYDVLLIGDGIKLVVVNTCWCGGTIGMEMFEELVPIMGIPVVALVVVFGGGGVEMGILLDGVLIILIFMGDCSCDCDCGGGIIIIMVADDGVGGTCGIRIAT